MLFKVLTDKGLFYYSALENIIYDSNMQMLDFSNFAKVVDSPKLNEVVPFDFTDDIYPYPKKDKKIRHLKIQVGTNCNYKCSYCIQASDSYKSVPVAKKEDIDRFFKILDESGMQLLPKAMIHLWGGEPLVYWKALVYLIPELRKHYPESQIWFTSNGTLLTEDKLWFLIDYKVDLTFSHDGPAYFLRGKNPLDDPEMLKLWRKTKDLYKENGLKFDLNAVISQYNANLYDLDQYLVDKLGQDLEYKYEDVVIVHSPNAVQFTVFSKDKQKALEDSVLNCIFNTDPASIRINKALHTRLMHVLTYLVYRVPCSAIDARCNAARSDVLSITLDGTVISCHNVAIDNQSMGNILEYDHIKIDKFKHWSLRSNCPRCQYVVACRGNCIRNSDVLHAAGCASKRVLSHALLKAVWFLLTGSTIIKFERV